MYYITNISLFCSEGIIQARLTIENTIQHTEDKLSISLDIPISKCDIVDLEWYLLDNCLDNFWNTMESLEASVIKQAKIYYQGSLE